MAQQGENYALTTLLNFVDMNALPVVPIIAFNSIAWYQSRIEIFGFFRSSAIEFFLLHQRDSIIPVLKIIIFKSRHATPHSKKPEVIKTHQNPAGGLR